MTALTSLDLRREARHRPPAMTADDAEARLRFLIACGFAPDAADKVFDAIDLPPIDNIRGKLEDLKALGFDNPVKMITSSPAILGLSVEENIRPKLAALKDLGFDNPVKMITSSPAILGYAIDNIRGKLEDLKALGFDNPVKMITSIPAILGYSSDRLRLCGEIIARLEDRRDALLAQLISKRRVLLDKIDTATPRCWREVRIILAGGRSAANASP